MLPLGQVIPPGFFLVDKPVGPSSAGVTGRLKWLLAQHYGTRTKAIKIGHGGTLDPLACGLLPIGIGKATKFLQPLLEGPKSYRFTLQFGTATTTDDREGAITAESSIRPTLAAIQAILPCFTGSLSQTPPSFSALKVGGQRAYILARAGANVTLIPRNITIHTLTISPDPLSAPPSHLSPPANHPTTYLSPPPTPHLHPPSNDLLPTITLTCTVSKGTYIRVLARDLALALGTVGHVTFLQRIQHGSFTLTEAVPYATLDKALQTGDWHSYLRPLVASPAGV